MEYVILDEEDKANLEEAQEIMMTTYFENFDKVTIENLLLIIRDLVSYIRHNEEKEEECEEQDYERF